MLQIKPTEHFTGLTIQGDYNDFSELMDSINRITTSVENVDSFYYGVSKKLLEIRHEIQCANMYGKIVLKDNGMNDTLMSRHKINTPMENVYYSANVLFPEAIFVAASVPKMYGYAASSYEVKRKDSFLGFDLPPLPYVYYIRDKANLDVLCAGIWQALGKVIGNEELQMLLKKVQQMEDNEYIHYATHYIDKCNIVLLETPVEKRKEKLKNIAKNIIEKSEDYKRTERYLEHWSKECGTSIYNLCDQSIGVPFPNEIDW